jgi:hypothetical protein
MTTHDQDIAKLMGLINLFGMKCQDHAATGYDGQRPESAAAVQAALDVESALRAFAQDVRRQALELASQLIEPEPGLHLVTHDQRENVKIRRACAAAIRSLKDKQP